ncbi:MAG: anthranilate synthase component I family protein [Bacteroidia bacterium]
MLHVLNELEIKELKKKCLIHSNSFDYALILDNNFQKNAFGLQSTEFFYAAGYHAKLETDFGNAFDQLESFIQENKGQYIFLFLSYDLKNEIEHLFSAHLDPIGFPALTAIVPKDFIRIHSSGELTYSNLDFINSIKAIVDHNFPKNPSIEVEAKVSKEDYIHTVQRIRNHIIDGDVYELNYCTEFFAKNAMINPYKTYSDLNELSPTPFSVFAHLNGKYMMGASPERFLKKVHQTLYSQPIKGTSKRSSDPNHDQLNKAFLLNSEKEKAENLMIVDLVRNDLAKSAKTGTVKVEELYGIYSFKQVHQMISTVSAIASDEINISTIIRNAFPMGSMTGAPKVKAMQLIDQYEQTKRGLYSGAVGYISPEGGFDLNVVIRSLQYNAEKKYLNFEVGSAITFDSDPEEEYKECLLKAEAMIQVLAGK